MKNTRRKNIILHTIIMVIGFYMCTMMSCKKDDPKPTQAQKITKLLTANGGTWNMSGVTIDGIDVTQDLFAGFSITFSEGVLTTTGTSPVWLREDTWTFKDDTATILIRGQDGKEVTIENVTSTELQLSLMWDQTTFLEEGGRRKSLPGKHVFSLSK